MFLRAFFFTEVWKGWSHFMVFFGCLLEGHCGIFRPNENEKMKSFSYAGMHEINLLFQQFSRCSGCSTDVCCDPHLLLPLRTWERQLVVVLGFFVKSIKCKIFRWNPPHLSSNATPITLCKISDSWPHSSTIATIIYHRLYIKDGCSNLFFCSKWLLLPSRIMNIFS